MTPLESTIQDRDSLYGGFANVCGVSQRLKEIVNLELLTKYGTAFPHTHVQLEALGMILHKIARIVCGDPNYVDNWHDIAGYATLVERDLKDTIQEEDTSYQS